MANPGCEPFKDRNGVNRKLSIFIDKSTWPGAHIHPLFPRKFHKGLSEYDLNIPEMLLTIGYLTTPAAVTGVSLSEFWAWVRYLAAITPNDVQMKLTKSFASLDPHQKTILSDDFGMGVSMAWLWDTLDFDLVVDGIYFMRQHARTLGVTQRRLAKRGPNKTPDFVARDSKGRWHVIECKGTQSGVNYSTQQLAGGVAQKHSLVFPPNYTGQRLVCGLTIGLEDMGGSRLHVIDPPPDEPVEILSSEIPQANDAATRGVMSKLLRMSGFENAAEAVALPEGVWADVLRTPTRAAADRQRQALNERDTRIRSELTEDLSQRQVFEDGFIGRETKLALPRALRIDGVLVTHVIIQQGVNRDAVDELADQPTVTSLLQQASTDWPKLIGRNYTSSDGLSASLRIGKLFKSQIHLES